MWVYVILLYDVVHHQNRPILLNSPTTLPPMASHPATVPVVNEDVAFRIIRLSRVDLNPKVTSMSAGIYRVEKGSP